MRRFTDAEIGVLNNREFKYFFEFGDAERELFRLARDEGRLETYMFLARAWRRASAAGLLGENGIYRLAPDSHLKNRRDEGVPGEPACSIINRSVRDFLSGMAEAGYAAGGGEKGIFLALADIAYLRSPKSGSDRPAAWIVERPRSGFEITGTPLGGDRIVSELYEKK